MLGIPERPTSCFHSLKREADNMTDKLSDICSVTLQGEASSNGQTMKHKQKQDTGIDKTHFKVYDNSYIPLAVLEDKFVKLHVKCRTKFL